MMGQLSFVPSNEIQTREWFAAHISESEYSIVVSQSAFPDYVLQTDDGQTCRVEVEHRSVNFIQHGHSAQGCDFVLCWIHDAMLPLPVLELSTGKRYKPGQVNESLYTESAQPKTGLSDKTRAKIGKAIQKKARSEHAEFLRCYVQDLKKRDEVLELMTKTRLELLSATSRLIAALRLAGINIGNLHPDDLFKIVV